MADAYHYFGQDLSVSATGSLALASGDDETVQRVLRRLLTNPDADVWSLTYGAGLGRYVGQPARVAAIRGTILRQMRLEPSVSQSPTPTVVVSVSSDGTVTARIGFVDAVTQRTVTGAAIIPSTGPVTVQLANSIANGT